MIANDGKYSLFMSLSLIKIQDEQLCFFKVRNKIMLATKNNFGVATVDIFSLVHSAVRFRGSCQLRWLGFGCVCSTTRISRLMSAAAVRYGSWRLTLGCQVSWVMSVEVVRFWMRV